MTITAGAPLQRHAMAQGVHEAVHPNGVGAAQYVLGCQIAHGTRPNAIGTTTAGGAPLMCGRQRSG